MTSGTAAIYPPWMAAYHGVYGRCPWYRSVDYGAPVFRDTLVRSDHCSFKWRYYITKCLDGVNWGHIFWSKTQLWTMKLDIPAITMLLSW